MVFNPFAQAIQDAIDWFKREVWNHKYTRIEIINLWMALVFEFIIILGLVYVRFIRG